MFRWLSTANWPFAVKFAVPCLMALTLVVVVEIVAIGSMQTIKTNLHDVVERKYNASLLLEQSVDRLRATNGELYMVQLKQATGVPQDIHEETKRLADGLDQISESLSLFKLDYGAEVDTDKIDDAIKNVKTYRKAVSFVGSMLDMDFKATVEFVLPLRGAYEGMIDNLSSISNAFLVSSREDSLAADKLAYEKARFIYVFSILSLLATLLVMTPVIYSTARSIATLGDATERLADGDTGIDLQALTRGDELGRLVKALTVFRDNIDRVAALKKVSLLYASMNAMMDSLTTGLCSFGPDGICSDTFSRAWIDLIGELPVGRHISDILGLSVESKNTLDGVLKLLFGGKKTMAMPHQELLDMFPKSYHRSSDDVQHAGQSSISLAYSPILNSVGKIQSVLVIATDHSDEILAARLNKEREEKVLMALRILSNRNQFIQFLTSLMQSCSRPEQAFANLPLDQVKRIIHTYKGMALTYYLQEVAGALHDIENSLSAASDVKIIWPDFVAALLAMDQPFARIRKEVAAILGENFDRQGSIRTLSLTDLHRFVGNIDEARDVAEVHDKFVQIIMGEPIQKILTSVDTEIRSLADRYSKTIAPCKFEGEDFSIMTENYFDLLASFTHISRNIIDHAIDAPDVRKSLGKPAQCTVTIITKRFVRRDREWMQIIFSDDGGGIRAGDLRKKLLSRTQSPSLAEESDEKIIQHIFDEDVSTATRVTELSGRGVGLSAVKHEAEKLGGTAYVESEAQRFTRITVEVPMIWDR